MVNPEKDLHWAQCLWTSVRQPLSSPWCTEAQALPGILVSCTELCELFCSGGSPGIDWHSQLFCPDGEPRGRLALGPVSLGLCPSATCPAPGALKLRSFLTPWSPALSCVSSSVQVGPLALTGIGEWHLLASWSMNQAAWGCWFSLWDRRVSSGSRGMGSPLGRDGFFRRADFFQMGPMEDIISEDLQK
ncbi:uncharacterized protein LOC105719965 isoform X2 [Aotus nancymaae]|uniref:uncharacterized protein LOC105719965 isoform X2 n=1 Tax=Aotus nancymaae TaxID=37293 RepID=UPI0030FEB203